MKPTFAPIAIVGAGCVLPGAHTPGALWDAVVAGRDLLTETPAGRWGVADKHVWRAPSASGEGTWSSRGGYVDGFDAIWDASRFVAELDALDALDPLVRWVAHAGADALAGCRADGARRAKCGLVVGNLSFPTPSMADFAAATWLQQAAAHDPTWARIAARAPEAGDPRDRFMSGLPAALAARALGLGGDAFALDAACASGLYALDIACRRLHEGAADLMLAGAVNRADDLFIHVGFCALGAISRVGASRPFDAAADGLIPAEGAAMLALKRLADAERDGDRVLAVIRGVGLSNDGRGRSLLAPAVDGQVRAMRAAWASAGLSPGDVGLLECHATGTPVGDATEVQSMSQVFAGAHGVPIGSLKSNLGHLVTTAGTAAIIKIIGALDAGVLPPTLHVESPIAALDGTPFAVQRRATAWPDDRPRLAGVSAFGFGGNNAHVVLGEHVAGAGDMVFAPVPVCDVAVVGMAVRAGDVSDIAALGSVGGEHQKRIEQIALPVRGLRFPPRELEASLGQQTLALLVATEACAGLDTSGRTGVWVGMGADTEVARYGARWRLAEWAGDDAPALDAARDGFVAALDAGTVVGTMPNIPANRLNRQLAAESCGYTVSSEELSGIDALSLAGAALSRGECDLAVVVAVDLSADPVHEAALRAVLGRDLVGGDAAIALVLRRAGDAGDAAIATVKPTAAHSSAPVLAPGVRDPLTAALGHAHAASGLLHVAHAIARLEPGAGEDVTMTSFTGRTATIRVSRGTGALPAPVPSPTDAITLATHLPAVSLPTWGTPAPARAPARGTTMMPAPALPRFGSCAGAPAASTQALAVPVLPAVPAVAAPALSWAPAHPGAAAAQAIGAHAAQVAALHTKFIEDQRAFDAQFLATWSAWGQAMGSVGDAAPPTMGYAAPPAATLPAPTTLAAAPQPAPGSATAVAAPASPAAASALPGPKFSRADLEFLSRGPISERFGAQFAELDRFDRVVRMPEPPMLLADRVLGIDAEPCSMGTGRIWTETDVVDDAWYMHHGAMPAGILIESGQADLLLISWLGADFGNAGERVYRLLGCELTYHGGLPKPGETLRYAIDVDGHARQGDIRLFFFHYDCVAGDQARLSVRHGQAGFFTDAELADSMGVLWSPDDEPATAGATVAAPFVRTSHRAFDEDAVRAFAEGRVVDCFGEAFALAGTHTRTPRIARDRMQLFERVTEYAPEGGPAGRGYLRAELDLHEDAWFFDGHFHNDPCMPGTLMFEGCLQTMAFFMAAEGHTLQRDGWRFEPNPGEPFSLICRGQATPSSRKLVYEVFVDELRLEPEPVLYAHILATVDGLKAFFCRRMGLRLTPDVPQTTAHATGTGAIYDWRCDDGLVALATRDDDGGPPRRPTAAHAMTPAAHAGGLVLDERTMLASAWGTPEQAFGALYADRAPGFRIPRLPGPPYLFMSRIAEIEAEPGSMKAGGRLVAEFAWDEDAWFFARGGAPAMPFAVLLEAALQPCGWLASWTGGAAVASAEVLFRNLDGRGTVHREIPPGAGVLRTAVEGTRVSRLGSTTIVDFAVTCTLGGETVFSFDTSFGFFPPEALATQAGLPERNDHRDLLLRGGDAIDLRSGAAPWGHVGAMSSAPLRMLDRVTGAWDDVPGALGAMRGEKLVDPSEWFFRAHFYRDPVQPGSLGVEALIQLGQAFMLRRGLLDRFERPVFEPIASGHDVVWRYRGQVTPAHRVIHTTARALTIDEGERDVTVTFDGSLWCDGLRIYELTGLAVRARETA